VGNQQKEPVHKFYVSFLDLGVARVEIYYLSLSVYPPSVILTQNPPPKPPLRPIIHEICSNSLGAFSGFGRHLANDFLFGMLLFPGMPSYEICSNDALFMEFEDGIHEYLLQFRTDDFFKAVTRIGVANSDNPFAFQQRANDDYMRLYILVFRRVQAKVPIPLYQKYIERGLLDEKHTIGVSFCDLFRIYCSYTTRPALRSFYNL
jgi:hypothetical protein